MTRKYGIIAVAFILLMASLISVKDKEIALRVPTADTAKLEAADGVPKEDLLSRFGQRRKSKTPGYAKKRPSEKRAKSSLYDNYSDIADDFDRIAKKKKTISGTSPSKPKLPASTDPSSQPTDTDPSSDSGDSKVYAFGGGGGVVVPKKTTPTTEDENNGNNGNNGGGNGGGGNGGGEDTTPAPIITAITPDSGVSGSTTFIQGTNFSDTASDNSVTFGSTNANSSLISTNQLESTIPSTASYGFTDVSAATKGKSSNNISFNVLQHTPNHIFEVERTIAAPIVELETELRVKDIDGDTDLDILLLDSTGAFALFKNSGSGTFIASDELDSLDSQDTISEIHSLADINGDGSLDVVTADTLPGNVDYLIDIITGDVDRNGDLDIFTATDANDGRNRIYINDGKGTYTDETNSLLLQDDTSSKDAEFGDVNNDGFLDIVVVNGLGEPAGLFMNNGSGGYIDEGSVRFQGATLSYEDAEFGDIDGDGYLDIVLIDAYETALFINDRTGVFEDASNKLPPYEGTNNIGGSDIELGDVDDDGDLDIVVVGTSLTVLLNEPASTNLPPVLTVEPDVTDIWASPGDSWIFYVTATDPEGNLPITIRWYANGDQIGVTQDEFSLMALIFGTGNHVVSVTAEDSLGNSSSHTWSVHVGQDPGQNLPPVILVKTPDSSEVPIFVNQGSVTTQEFRIISYIDPDGDDSLVSFLWEMKEGIDGTYEIIPEPDPLNPTPKQRAIALTPGEYYIRVTLTDSGLPPASTQFVWHVTVTETGGGNQPPVIDATNPPNSELGPIYIQQPGDTAFPEFYVSQYRDPDGDSITFRWEKRVPGGAYEEIPNLSGRQGGVIALDLGEYYIKVTITDDGIPAMSDSFEWHVNVLLQTFEDLIDDITEAGFMYFWNEVGDPADPNFTGLIRDIVAVDPNNRHSGFDPSYDRASAASTGFGLAAFTIASRRYEAGEAEWQNITKAELEARAETILDTLLGIQGRQATSEELWGKDGFFYHYMDINNGTRWMTSEVSTIDTTLLIAGALTAGEYFGGTVKTKALDLYKNVNWKAFLDVAPTMQNQFEVANQHYNQLYHGWKPGEGFFGHWDYTSECLLIYLLAVASPELAHAIPPETFYSFTRELGNYGQNGKPLVQTWFGTLFTYQYPQAFFNFKNDTDERIIDSQGVDWWNNSVEATIANKKFCNDSIARFAGDENLWGLTPGFTSGFNYSIYAAPPAAVEIPSPHGVTPVIPGADGTVMPQAPGGSIPFLPFDTLSALNRMKELYDNYGHQVWGEYGFVDSFKVGARVEDTPFPISQFFVGIDLGITLLMAENNLSGLVWENFGNFEVETGTTLRTKILDQIGFNLDHSLTITADDESRTGNFHMGIISPRERSYSINFNLASVYNAPYMLAIHSAMNEDLGDHSVTAKLIVNDNNNSPIMVTFEYDTDGIKADLMEYIEISPSLLRRGDNNITIEWDNSTNGANWLAWRNVEISSPVINDRWTIARDLQANPKVLFGNEYNADDTYYVGRDLLSCEQAINKDRENFTDILFYTEATEYGILRINALETHRNFLTNLVVFANGSDNPVFDGRILAGDQHQIETEGFYLQDGWNHITLYYPGIGNGGYGEWIRWNSLAFESSIPPDIPAPRNFVGASFGKNEVRLRWESVVGAAEYVIYRSPTSGGGYAEIDTVIAPVTTYVDSDGGFGLPDNNVYYYVVRSANIGAGLESPYSQEIKVALGPYEVDYGDGHDPNVFGGLTLDNSGAPLGDNAYMETIRYDGTIGHARRLALDARKKNTINLNNVNINDAGIFSIRFKSDEGGEKFKIRLNSPAGSDDISLESAAPDTWQELHFYLGTDFQHVDLEDVTSLEVISEEARDSIMVYLDEIEFNTVDLEPNRLDVKVRNRQGDALAGGLDFGSSPMGTTYVTAGQYIDIGYAYSGSWNIQIYFNNKAEDAFPRFMGEINSVDRWANGLIGMVNGGYRVPLKYQVFQTKMYTNPGDNPPWDDDYQTAYIVDRSDYDWWGKPEDGYGPGNPDPYTVGYRVIFNDGAELGYPLDPVNENVHRLGTVGENLYVYVGGDFTDLPGQRYTTSKLMVEIVTE